MEPLPEGIITVLNTPFTTSGAVDLEALNKHVDYALQAGVAGFLVPAMASEVHKLSKHEKLHMVSTVIDRTHGKVPVFAGAGSADIAISRSMIESYIDLGCRYVLFQIQFDNEQQFKKDFIELAAIGPKVIMLQDWDASGHGLPESLILELFEEVEAFKCLKIETVPANLKYSRMLQLTSGRLHVSGGWAVMQMIEGLQRGVNAFMPTGMHYIYTEIYRLFKNGKTDDAERLFYQLLPILNFSNQHLDISIHFFKHLLHQQNIYKTPNVREPILPFDDIQLDFANVLIKKAIDLEEKIRIKRT